MAWHLHQRCSCLRRWTRQLVERDGFYSFRLWHGAKLLILIDVKLRKVIPTPYLKASWWAWCKLQVKCIILIARVFKDRATVNFHGSCCEIKLFDLNDFDSMRQHLVGMYFPFCTKCQFVHHEVYLFESWFPQPDD